MSSVICGEQYIYIIQVEEDFETDIYKIGRTYHNPFKRFQGYSGKIRIIQFNAVIDSKKTERTLIAEFKKKFGTPVRGREYFKGNLNNMIEIFNKIVEEDRHTFKIDEEQKRHLQMNKSEKYKKINTLKCLLKLMERDEDDSDDCSMDDLFWKRAKNAEPVDREATDEDEEKEKMDDHEKYVASTTREIEWENNLRTRKKIYDHKQKKAKKQQCQYQRKISPGYTQQCLKGERTLGEKFCIIHRGGKINMT
jgi:hypothetical protein